MGFHHFRPGAKFVFHAEQLGLREFVFQFVHDFRVIYAVVIVGDDSLRLRAVEPVQVGFCCFFRTVGLHIFIDPRHREFRQNVGFRNHHFKALRFILFADVVHFRLEADQHIAQAALGKSGGRATTASIEHFNVFQELGHKLFGFGFVATVSFIRCAPCRQIGITRVTRRFRVRENQLHVGAHQVVPVVDILRVALTHQEAHGGVERRAIIRQARLPVRRDKLAFIVQNLYVGHLVISDNVGF